MDLRTAERIEVTIERLPDESISVKAINRSTGRVLLDRAFVDDGCLETVRFTITKAGLFYEAS